MRREKREKKEEKTKKKKKGGKIFLIFLLIFIACLGAFLGYRIQKNGGGLQGMLVTMMGQNIEKLEDVDPINILVLRCK